ncbi:MAG: hypothetical protein C5B51_26665 [Terriglobia bacterium]|nr:MAG: hypothetical protein C5B51_26665 [Terriglobia bacterium]
MAPAGFKTGLIAVPPKAAGAWPRFLLPNMAAMLAAAALVYCLFLYGAGSQFFRDSDTGWHIRNGEWIAAHGALPQGDPYSFSVAGQRWYAWEWGSDVVMGLAHRVDGLRGVASLFAIVVFASTWLCCRLHFAAGGDFFLTALLMPLTVTAAGLHWLARPHLLSWLFLLAALLYAERAPLRFGVKELAIVAAGTAVWANMHASFLMAPAIALIYAKAHLLRPFLWRLDRGVEMARARWFLKAAVAAACGSLLNPYGWRLWQHIFAYLGNDELTSRIAEFQSFNFHANDARQVALVMILALAGGVLALSQKKLAHFALSMLFVWAALRSARVIPMVALLVLPLANGALTEALRNTSGLRPRLSALLDSALRYSWRLRRIDRDLGGAAFCCLTLLFCLSVMRLPALSKQIGFPQDRFPVRAANAVEKLPPDARLLAPDSYGGYLIYRFQGSRKVYFDGRSDLYGAAFMKQYLTLIEARPGWQETVRSFRFTHALLPKDSALRAVLEQAGWVAIHQDDVAILLEAR